MRALPERRETDMSALLADTDDRGIELVHPRRAASACRSGHAARSSLTTQGHRLLALLASLLMALLAVSLLPRAGMAHEAWLLTPEHMAELDARPRPELFTRLTVTNAAMLAAAAAAVVGWVLLATTGVANRFSSIAAKLEAHECNAALVVRVCLALTFTMAATGLHPRHGTGLLQAASLGFPDLELRLLGAGWGWLAAVEFALAAALLLGLHVRAAALGTLLLTIIGLKLFGTAMLAYAGAMTGAALYLVLRGGGPLSTALLVPAAAKHALTRLERQPRERAVFLVRLLTGATFLYCGVYYKVLQPNLALAIVVEGGVPTFGLPPEVFVLGMAAVEVSAGALMMAGVLIRPMALALFGPFLFLGIALGENPLGHMLFYGNLVVLATGGAGSWSRAAKRDVSARPRIWSPA
jgi:uncharacterized membrane protein YphA (DoxX/SURF4 family)